jgi:tetratricopeptide (TPR) repeat protein
VRACEASLKAALDKPAESLELAAFALDVARELSEDSAGGGSGPGRSQLQGYCWGHLANARRVATDFEGAHEGFARAWELWRAGQQSASRWLPEWRLLSLEASLRREQRRFPESLKLLNRALVLGKDEPAAMARCLLQKEHVYEVLGDFAAALDALAQAAPFVEASGEPNLLFALRYNTADDLRHLKRFAEAAVLLPEIRELALQRGAELDGLRVALLAARITAGLGRKEEAVVGLEQVRQRFTDLELPYEAALSSLDLAVLWLEERHTAEVRELALTMAWIFDAKGIHREALAALQLFREAAERDALTVDLGRRAIAEIERVKRSGLR